jgi:site-specific DNA-methyltransferase (adenine-specific)
MSETSYRASKFGEVFTEKREVDEMLDLVREEIQRLTSCFLEPACGTGNFLAEVMRRKMIVLRERYVDNQDDYEKASLVVASSTFGVDIQQESVFGCRKRLYTIFDDAYRELFPFPDPEFLQKIQSTLGKNIVCADMLKDDVFPDKQFDVIIGKPPYHKNDGGFGKSSSPLYNKFVDRAKEMNPRFLVMIIPSRWFSGGKGLDDFRKSMLNDKRIKKIVNYEKSNDVFPGTDFSGGVCFFLWDRTCRGQCEITNIVNNEKSVSVRSLDEFPLLIRDKRAVSVIRKVSRFEEPTMDTQVSERNPFGLPTTYRPMEEGDISLRCRGGSGPVLRSAVLKNTGMIDSYKVIVSYVSHDHAGNPGKDGKRKVFSKIDVLHPGVVCTETYLVVGCYENKDQAENLVGYMKTKFFRFLVSQFMSSHHITKSAYAFVPVQDMNKEHTDEQLYRKYELSDEDIEFIESSIR